MSFSCLTHSEDLLSVYEKTKNSSPYVKMYLSERNKAYEKISESRSKLLPQIGLNTSLSYGSGYRVDANKDNHQLNGSLTLTQSIFDLSKWKGLDIQEKQAGIADISYQKAQQDIILETATAYFNVLKSIDSLYYINANKKAVYSQLDQATQRFNVGLSSIVDVQNARANYDTILAKEISARNDFDNSIENLKKISGGNYNNLSSLDTNKFSTVKPDDVSNIIDIANKRNLSPLKANLLNDVSLIDIELSESGHLPTVKFNASTSVSNQHYYGNNAIKDPYTGKNRNIYSDENNVGISVDVPIYSGGATTSKVKQSIYGNQVSLENLWTLPLRVIRLEQGLL